MYKLAYPSCARFPLQGARAAAARAMDISPSSLHKTSSSPSVFSSSADEMSPKDLLSVKLDEAHFARDPVDKSDLGCNRGVQIRVDSSESRTITAAQNFEGLEKSKPGPEEKESSGGSSDENKPPADGKAYRDVGEGAGQGGDDLTTPRVSGESAGKEQGRSSSRLQVQLKEYDRRRMEDEQKREGSVQPPLSLAKTPLSSMRSYPSPARTLEEGAAVRFSQRSGSMGDSPHQACVRSPDSSSSSSATQVLDVDVSCKGASVCLRQRF